MVDWMGEFRRGIWDWLLFLVLMGVLLFVLVFVFGVDIDSQRLREIQPMRYLVLGVVFFVGGVVFVIGCLRRMMSE